MIKIIYITCILFFISASSAQAVLLDKVRAVFNQEIISNSQVLRVKSTLSLRKQISPQIYEASISTDEDIVRIFVQSLLIRETLAQLGYIISKDQVNSNIEDTQKRLGLSKSELKGFLKNGGLTFDEYFEITKQNIEYNIFFSRVISPLVTISEQDIKNLFIKKYQQSGATSFNFDLIQISLPARLEEISLNTLRLEIEQSLIKMGPTKYLESEMAEKYPSYELTKVKQEDLNEKIGKGLLDVKEGELSKIITIDNKSLLFFVISKNIINSTLYSKVRPQLQNELYDFFSSKTLKDWFSREMTVQYFKTY